MPSSANAKFVPAGQRVAFCRAKAVHGLSCMLRIKDHRLIGDGVSFRATPNHGGDVERALSRLPLHSRALVPIARSSRCAHVSRSDNASAHWCWRATGASCSSRLLTSSTWHAGVSHWNGGSGLNQAGRSVSKWTTRGGWSRVGDKYRGLVRQGVRRQRGHARRAQAWRWRSDHGMSTPKCRSSARSELAELLVNHYALDDVLGHEDIARGRKQDPGPAFPLASIASARSVAIRMRRCAMRLPLTLSISARVPAASFEPAAAPSETRRGRLAAATRQPLEQGRGRRGPATSKAGSTTVLSRARPP